MLEILVEVVDQYILLCLNDFFRYLAMPSVSAAELKVVQGTPYSWLKGFSSYIQRVVCILISLLLTQDNFCAPVATHEKLFQLGYRSGALVHQGHTSVHDSQRK